jgi:mono/diheme cytochrome c family protein
MLFVFLLSVNGKGLHAQAQGPQTAPSDNAANGKKLYNEIGCWQCHGYSGQGGAGAKIAPDPIPLAGFTRYVRKPAGQMPPYSEKVVNDAQLADIYAFLKTIPKPPDAKSIPMLNGN